MSLEMERMARPGLVRKIIHNRPETRIRETLGSDFDDPDEVLYLMLSFRLLDNEKRRTKEEGHSA